MQLNSTQQLEIRGVDGEGAFIKECIELQFLRLGPENSKVSQKFETGVGVAPSRAERDSLMRKQTPESESGGSHRQHKRIF